MSMTRRRLLDDTFKKSVVGNPAIAQGSLARRYPGITMQGWTEQAQYEGNNLFDISKVITKEGVVINNGDGTLTVKTAVDSNGVSAKSPNRLRDYCPDIVSGKTYYLYADSTGSEKFIYFSKSMFSWYFGSSKIITDADLGSIVYFYASGLSTEATVSNIMITEVSNAPYEQYAGNKPSPSPEYPQSITSAGKYNEDTQKWEYEIAITNTQTDPDKNQTVTIQSDRPLTKWDKLEKRGGQWGWVYKSNHVEMDGSETGFNENYLPILILGTVPTGVSTDRGSSVKPRYDIWSNYTDILVWSNSSCNECSINLNNSGFSTIGVNSADTFKQWLAQKYSEGNSFYYEYETSAETFVPLSESEQEAMNALYTYRPTTVLSNQQGCQMALTYKTRKSMEVTT